MRQTPNLIKVPENPRRSILVAHYASFILICLSLFLLGCATPKAIEVNPRSYLDWANPYAPVITTFQAGEIPTIVVYVPHTLKRSAGLENLFYNPFWGTSRPETGTLTVIESTNGAIIKTEDRSLELDHHHRFSFDLPTGSYYAILTIRGRQIARSNSFEVIASRKTSTQRGLIVTRLQDVQPGALPPSRDLFGPGEAPTFYIFGYDDETVTIVIRNLGTGSTVVQKTFFIPHERASYPTFDLPTGSYRCELTVGATTLESRTFRVDR